MPRKPREYLLRFADEALNDLDRSLEKVGNIQTAYKTGKLPTSMTDEELAAVAGENIEALHPEFVQAFENIGMIIAQARQFLSDMRNQYM